MGNPCAICRVFAVVFFLLALGVALLMGALIADEQTSALPLGGVLVVASAAAIYFVGLSTSPKHLKELGRG